MRAVRSFLIRLAAVVRGRRDSDFDEELAAHVDMHTADNVRLGMSPEEARRVALARLGGVQSARQRYQERQGLPPLEDLALDIRDALRSLARGPGFVIVTLVTIGIGVAGPTLLFAMARQWILDPLPFSEPGSLVDLRNLDRASGNYGSVSAADFLDWQREAASVPEMAAYRRTDVRLTGIERAEIIRGAFVTANFFDVLGTEPASGRLFESRDAAAHGTVVVISDPLARRQFGGATDVVGRTIRIDGADRVIAGVLPSGFQFTLVGAVDVWQSLVFTPAEAADRRVRAVTVLGRLAADRSVDEARLELTAIADRLTKAYPETNARRTIRVLGLADEVRLHHDAGIVIPVMFAMMICVLLIACVNVTNVMFARASTRRQEMAVRLAMGASRTRLVRQWLVEHVALFVAAGTLGVILAMYGTGWVSRSIPAENRQFLRNSGVLSVDGTVLVFGLIVSAVAGFVFGLMPAVISTRSSVNGDLREATTRSTSGRGATRFRAVLAVSEVALSLALLISAGLLVITARNVTAIDVGFEPKQLVTFRMGLDAQQYRSDADVRQFYERLLPPLERLPGITAAAAGTLVPFSSDGRSAEFFIEGEPETQPADTPRVALSEVTPGYAKTIGLELRSGRLLNEGDGAEAPRAALVNAALAARLPGGGDALGRRIRLSRTSRVAWTIVGVVGNVRNYETIEGDDPQVYLPFAQSPRRDATVVLRVTRELDRVSADIRAAVAGVDPTEPIIDLTTMEERIGRVTAPYEITSMFVMFFGAVTLILAGVGVYGVVAYSFAQRTREIGIRMSLGASPASAAGLVLQQVRTFLIAGVLPGVGLAWLLGQMMKGFLVGVPPDEWRVYLAMILLLAVVTLVAVAVPARRAAAIDPSVALRYE